MNQTEPREQELYEPPLVLDIDPFTVTCVVGESERVDDPGDNEGGL